MAKTGRPKIPTALRLLNGNRSRRPINDDEPKPEAVKAAIRCPSVLKKTARQEWRRVTKELSDMGILTVADRSPLMSYCQYYAKFEEAWQKMQAADFEMVHATESGYQVTTPWWAIANRAEDKMRAFWQEFGLTPASRTRIRVEKVKPVDIFEAYKNKKKRA